MIKRFLSIVLTALAMSVLLMAAPVCALTANEAVTFAGSGTPERPYEISSADDLAKLAEAVNGGESFEGIYFILKTDISLDSYNPWTPIGNNENPFSGTFDGNGNKISGLNINPNDKNYQGLFGVVNKGTVKRLGVVGNKVTGRAFVGGIVGANYGGTIESCYNACNVSGTAKVGGVVGKNIGGTVKNCYNIGSVTGTGAGYDIGGVVGHNEGNVTVENCYNTGTVSGAENVGGVAGYNEIDVKLQSCYNTGKVNGADGAQDVGGVVGNNVLSEIGNCYYEEGTASKGCGSSPDGSSEAGLTQGTPTTWDDDCWEMSEWLGRPVLKDNRLTVTFDYNYKDKDGKPQRVEYYVDYGSGFGTKPDFPEREGYVPKGWFEGGSEVGDDYFSSDEIITGNRIFTVQWELKEYKITYEIGDDGVNDERNPSKYTIEDEIEELYPASKEGYNFMGWYENEECTGDPVTKFGPGETGDKTFYAKWSKIIYTITYDRGDYGEGDDIPSDTREHGGDPVDLSEQTFTRTGYTQTGWVTSGGTKYDFGAEYNENASITLYPDWKANEYNVIYHIIDGTEETVYTGADAQYTTYVYNATLTLLPLANVTPKKEGHTLDGWYFGSYKSGDELTSLDKEAYTQDINLYAKWIANTYTITYEKNGGSITNESDYEKYTYGVGLDKLPTPTREGYTFVDWYTDSTFSNLAAEPAISTTETGDKTFYAKWEAKKVMVSFDSDGADGGDSTEPREMTFDSNYNLPTPTKTGHKFDGWYTEGGVKVTDSTKVTTAASHTLYARWTAETYTITYVTNGGSITNESGYKKYTYGKGMTLPTPTRTGYDFEGWYEDSNFSGDPITAIFKTDMGNKTFYAKWTLVQYKVTFVYNDADGDNSTAFINVTYGSTYGALGTLPVPTKTEHKFDGWYTKASGGVKVTDSTEVTTAADHFLYARWTANTYKVNFETNGGEFKGRSIVTDEYTYGEGMTLPTPERVGYDFGGWYANEDFSGAPIKEIFPTDTGEKTFYAMWTAKTFTVKFEYQEATSGNDIQSITVTYDSKYSDSPNGALPEPKKTGYIFGGWYTQQNGQGDQITADTKVSITSAQTLYAYWIADNTGGDSGDTGGGNTSGDNTGGDNTGGDNTGGDNTPSTGDTTDPSTGDNTDPSGGNGTGGVNIDVASGEKAPGIVISEESINELREEVIANHLTSEETAAIENGTVIDIILSVELVKDSDAIADKQVVEAALTDSGYAIGIHLNIELIKMINGVKVGTITDINTPIRVTVKIPEELRRANREFAIVRVHNGAAKILGDADDAPDTITIVTDKFSTYSIVYRSAEASDSNPNTGITLPITVIELASAIIVAAVTVKKRKIMKYHNVRTLHGRPQAVTVKKRKIMK